MNLIARARAASTCGRLASATLAVLLLSAPSVAQSASVTRLFPGSTQPQKDTTRLTSRDQRVGDKLYQVFTLRNKAHQEAFRVDVGFYTEGQLVSDWAYGIIVEKDMNGDGTPDYVWYGADDSGLRVLWFLSDGNHHDCINVLKTAERAWTKRFAQPAPDLEEVPGDDAVDEVTWDRGRQPLSVSVEIDRMDPTKAHRVLLRIAPADFLRGER